MIPIILLNRKLTRKLINDITSFFHAILQCKQMFFY